MVSLLTVLMTAACCSAPAFAQEASWGVSDRPLEKRNLPGIGFLDPEQTLMCKTMVSPVQGSFAPELVGQGEGFGFLVENESEVAVSVMLETRDASGELQGILITRVGPQSVHRLSLHFWTGSRSAVSMTTQVRVKALQDTDDISVLVGQQKVVSCSEGPDASGQVMDCSAQECSLRPIDPDLQGDDPVDPGQEGTGSHGPHGPGQEGTGSHGPHGPGQEGTGSHGPHQPGTETPGAEMPGVPGDGTGPHGPHLAGPISLPEDPDAEQGQMSQEPDQD